MLFFDDTLENVDGARAVGMRAVHVRSPADVAAALEEFNRSA
jgi:putative hydrolase of the HAD superfamily